MTQIIRSSFKPLYLQISDLIREDIESGKIVPGDRVWSEREIMDKFGISRNTAQQAIEELVRNGMVTRIQGRGTFVTESKASYGLQRLTSFSEEMRAKGMTPSAKILSQKRELPSPILIQKLQLEPEQWVIKLERLRLADDQPMAHQTSYIPERFCPGFEKYDFTKESLFTVIEKNYNLQLSWQEQVIKPVIARPEEALLLDVIPGSPLLLAEGVAYLEENIPIEYKRIFYRSDLYEFTIRSSRKQE